MIPAYYIHACQGEWNIQYGEGEEAWKRNGQAYGDIQGQAQVFALDFKSNGGTPEGCEQRDDVTGVWLQQRLEKFCQKQPNQKDIGDKGDSEDSSERKEENQAPSRH